MKTPQPEVRDLIESQHARRWFALVFVGLGAFMSTLDSTVVNAALPDIAADFDSSLGGIDWIVTIYLLTGSGLVLTGGRLADLRGHKRVSLSGFAIFTIASGLCAFAWNIETLTGFRMLQGVGAALIYAAGPAILVSAFPPHQRGRALGLMALATYGGLALGPSLGGFLADHIDWRAVFLINLPIGVVALLLGVSAVSGREETIKEPLDLLGGVVFFAGLAGLVLALHEVPGQGWLGTPVLLLFALSALFLISFALLERRVAAPILDLTLFRVRIFSAGAGSALVNYIGVSSVLFLFPFYFVTYQDYSLSESALLLTAMPAAMMATAPFSGWASDLIGSRLLSTSGMIALSAGLALLGFLGKDGGIEVLVPLTLIGIANGLFAPPNNSAIMGSVPRHQYGIAGSVLATARNLGLGLGVALASSLFRQRVDQGWEEAFQFVNFSLAGLMLVGAFTSSVRGAARPQEPLTITLE